MKHLFYLLLLMISAVPLSAYADTSTDILTAPSSTSVFVDLPIITSNSTNTDPLATPSSTITATHTAPTTVVPAQSETTTSTPSVLDTSTVSSTLSSVNPLAIITTSTSIVTSSTSTQGTASSSAVASVPSMNTSTICLAMIAAYPASGPEWIAVYGLTPSSSHRLLNWSFFDAQSSIGKITSSTPLLWDEPTQTLRFELKSARLNNDGDQVILKNDRGEEHDTYVYTEIQKDQRWVRTSCNDPWYIWPEPIIQTIQTAPTPTSTTTASLVLNPQTPPSMAVQDVHLPEASPIVVTYEVEDFITEEEEAPTPSTPIIEQKPPPAATKTLEVVAQTTMTQAGKTKTSVKSSSATPLPTTSIKTSTKAPSSKQSTKKKVPSPMKTAKKVTTRTNNTSSKSVVTIPSFQDMSPLLADPSGFQGIRVRITGVVATTPRFLGANKFVILNHDGRGLLIQGKNSIPSPTRGEYIELTGVINWNDAGISLKQQAQDTWKSVPKSDNGTNELPLRLISLVTPSQEDAWSHVEIEGHVMGAQASSIDLETEDGYPVRIKLPRLLGYRAARVKKDDVLRVRGVLDISTGEPMITPQILEDLHLIERAPLPTPKPTTKNEQPWLPAGIIAGTLSTSEGLRRLRAWRKKRLEQKAFAQFMQETNTVER